MRILRLRSKGVSIVTERDEKLCDKAGSIKGTEKNWTTLDIIVLAVWLVSQHAWSVGHLIDGDNPREKVDK